MSLLNRNLRSQGFCGTTEQMRQTVAHKRQRGFSMVELLIVVIILFILLSIAIPSIGSFSRSLRIQGDTRSIAAQVNLARMRAAADSTHARVYIDTSGNTFHMEIWNKAGACWWKTDADSSGTCTQTAIPTYLAQGDTFGFGSISAGPTAATSTIAQAPVCTVGVAGAAPGANISNTACIEFNSRGYPVTSANAIVASDAIYLTNNSTLFSAVAVSIAGQPAEYNYSGSSWAGL
jgi:prepilin-type N-terminal cleavage/methylation domain-containing protein